jgi:GcrA cell cycle regulator
METIWTPELIEQLAALWHQGLSTADIGRRINISKNAVVGKAHRLGLTARPSPLKRPPAPKGMAALGPSCSWPLGHPGEKGFRFCGAAPLAGKPYCAEHAALAYVRPKAPGSNAA